MRFQSPVTRSRVALALVALVAAAPAPPVRPDLYAGLVWRNVGPFRGGRISAVSGVLGEPGTFYIGLPAAGVWKTTSAGAQWYPIFDSVKEVSCVGAVEVAPSNPNIVYVGTGDLITGGGINEGNGMYKSTDAGKTWMHIGLDATKQIPSIVVDPRNPDVVLVAAQGDVHKKSQDRGVFRSTDGGKSWTRTLFADDSTGVQMLAYAYDRPDVIFASTVRHYAPMPGPNVVPPAAPAGGGRGGRGGGGPNPNGTALYKSTDGGVTWKELTGGNIPRIPGRTSIAVAMNTNAQRVFWTTNNGLFRSDDGGATWKQMDASDTRIRNGQGGYNSGIYVDSKNPDVVYSFATAAYISTDGGNTFTGFRGAPGGDDVQRGWVDPTDGKRMLFGYDQGAIVTLDGGKTWSSWYNQSTEQVYHINVDNSYPYWIYASQQDAGAVRTRSRGNMGEITPHDWTPVNSWEWGTVLPDPLNPNIVYGSGSGIVKISYPSEQWINVSPALNTDLRLRTTSSQPMVFAPWNQHQLITGFQYVMSTIDGGNHWTKISPDLTYPKGFKVPDDTATPVPGNPVGGAIEALSASSVGRGTIWVSTNNGLIKVTKDEGKTWDDATVPNIPTNPTRALMSGIEASHSVAGGAYAVADVHTSGDYAPHVYRTKDFGKTWTAITNGLPSTEPSGSFARVIREDPRRPGLLFLGTESGMYVSFNDGDDWQSLQLNLPNTSYRDIKFAGNDLVVGTYGRGIFILDDYAVLRQITPAVASEDAHLFKPDPAVRQRRNVNWNTPLPVDMPYALNAPEGAIIYYWLGSKPSGDVTLDILDSAGAVVRHYTSAAGTPVPEAEKPPHPNFWVAPPYSLPVNAGTNRMHWDIRYDEPPAFSHSFEINANPYLTPTSPEGAVAPPGTYTAKLTVNGKSYSEKFIVTNDPRSPATAADMRAQGALVAKINAGLKAAWDGFHQVDDVRKSLAAQMPSDTASAGAHAIRALQARLDSIGGGGGGGRGGRGGRGGQPLATFQRAHGEFSSQLNTHDNGDIAPTAAMLTSYASSCKSLAKAAAAWTALNTKGLAAINADLANAHLKPLTAAAGVKAPLCGP